MSDVEYFVNGNLEVLTGLTASLRGKLPRLSALHHLMCCFVISEVV